NGGGLMRRYLILIILLTCFFLVVACTHGETKTLEAFYKGEQIERVEKIIIQDGNTGESKTITDKEQIEGLLSLIKEIQFTPQQNQEDRTGWRYRITLIDGIREFAFLLNKIGNTYYDSNPDIHPI